MISDRDIIETAKQLHDTQPDLFGKHAETVQEWLNETPDDAPEPMRQTAYNILDLLQHQPEAQEAFRQQMDVGAEAFEVTRSGYQRLDGDPPPVSAGTMMVCPSGARHCRRKLRQKGQRLFCPDCGCELVPDPSDAEVE